MRVARTVPDNLNGPVTIPFTMLEPFRCQKDSKPATSRLALKSEGGYVSDVDEDPRVLLEGLRKKVTDLLAQMYSRRDDINGKIATLNGQISKAEEQLRLVDAALAGMDNSSTEDIQEIAPQTIKQAVLRVLGRQPQRGLGALEILERLRVDFGMDYERSSLSPQLSRLKTEGKIRLEHGKWFLVTKENGSEA